MRYSLATLYVTVALTVATVQAEPQRQDKRIVQGSPSTPYAWPSICSLKAFGGHMCGATLLQNAHGVFYLVTAAHCFCQCENRRPTGGCTQYFCPHHLGPEAAQRWAAAFTAHCGVHNINGDTPSHEQTLHIASIMDHENYDPLTKHNDIAVLTLATQPQETQWVQAAALPSSAHSNGDTAIAAGWGNTKKGDGILGSRPSHVLMQTRMNVKEDAFCTRMYDYDSQSMMCVKGAEHGSTCQGDSGGPVYTLDNSVTATNRHGQWRLGGVVSHGKGCGQNYPEVLADTYRLRNWINQKVNN